MSSTVSFYAVRRGTTPGVYTTWGDCKKAIDGFSFPVYRKFDSEDEANDFVQGVEAPASKTASAPAPGPACETTLPFGKFKGQTIEAVAQSNRGYLEWLLGEMKKSGKTEDAICKALQRVVG